MNRTAPRAPSTPWRVGDVLFGLLFAYSAFVNANDPDGPMWVAIYLAGAIATAVGSFGRLSASVAALMAGLYGLTALGVGLMATGGSQDMKGFPQYGIFTQELVRESLGLALVALWMAAIAWRTRRAAQVT